INCSFWISHTLSLIIKQPYDIDSFYNSIAYQRECSPIPVSKFFQSIVQFRCQINKSHYKFVSSILYSSINSTSSIHWFICSFVSSLCFPVFFSIFSERLYIVCILYLYSLSTYFGKYILYVYFILLFIF